MIKYVTQTMFIAIIFSIYNKLSKNNNNNTNIINNIIKK